MANVTLRHIYKVYPGGVTAVNDFNLVIKDKEFIVLVGPSGCGKTTTLRMVAGLEEVSEGDLFIGDKRVNDIPPKQRDIAMVFQNYALYPHMTVYENMAFGLKLRKVHKTDIDKKVKETAKILGIEDYLNRKPKALSGGQRQRVALGRAIVRDPQVFLMDEPLSNLDAKLRVQMRTEITKLHNTLATTFIYVTHDQTEAMTMGTRIVVMKDGFIQQVDSPQNLYDYPCNKFVAGFIGSPAMNFIDCTLIEKEGKVYARFGENKILIPEGKIAKLTDKSYIGKDVILGIRPDDIKEEEVYLQNYPEATVSAKIELLEKLGFETLVYLIISGHDDGNIVSRFNPRSTVMMDDTVKVVFDPNRIHLFDKETEVSILANG